MILTGVFYGALLSVSDSTSFIASLLCAEPHLSFDVLRI